MPKITVAMAVYNDAPYIQEAINSILNQSFTDFQLLIINDGSTDHTPQLIENYNDNRIRVIHFEQNKGRPFARNKALQEASGKYLAWMDADDISPHNRLEKQVNFMDKNPHISLCGGQMQCFGESNHLVKLKTSNEAIRAGIIWYCSMSNATICMNLDNIHKNNLHYHEDLLRVEDYAFLSTLCLKTKLQLANIPEILIDYRYFNRPTTPIYHVKAVKYVLQALNLPSDELSCQKHTILSIGMHDGMPSIAIEDMLIWADTVYNAVIKRNDIEMRQFLRVSHAKVEAFLNSISNAQNISMQQALRKYATLALGKTHDLRKLFKLYVQ